MSKTTDEVLVYSGVHEGMVVTKLESSVRFLRPSPHGFKPLVDTYVHTVVISPFGTHYSVYLPEDYGRIQDKPLKEQMVLWAYLTLFYEEGFNALETL